MSVLVRGMEMPKGCFFCPMRIKIDPDTIRCLATGNDFEETLAGTIERRNNGNCPLVEVKEPHGRLVDADAFKETIDYYIREANWSDAHNEALGWAKEFIDNEQAVVEAEVEDVASHTRQLARQAGKILVDAALNAIKESEGSEQ